MKKILAVQPGVNNFEKIRFSHKVIVAFCWQERISLRYDTFDVSNHLDNNRVLRYNLNSNLIIYFLKKIIFSIKSNWGQVPITGGTLKCNTCNFKTGRSTRWYFGKMPSAEVSKKALYGCDKDLSSYKEPTLL